MNSLVIGKGSRAIYALENPQVTPGDDTGRAARNIQPGFDRCWSGALSEGILPELKKIFLSALVDRKGSLVGFIPEDSDKSVTPTDEWLVSASQTADGAVCKMVKVDGGDPTLVSRTFSWTRTAYPSRHTGGYYVYADVVETSAKVSSLSDEDWREIYLADWLRAGLPK